MDDETMRTLFSKHSSRSKDGSETGVPALLTPEAGFDGRASARSVQTVMPLELEKLYGPRICSDPIDADVDIVLIHGLGGHRQSTWTKNASFWPKALLAEDTPSARIITYGYPADTFKLFDVVSIANPTEHAQRFCTELANLREGLEDRPLIFVAHSMGGIVVKKAPLQAKDSNIENIAPIADDTRGVLFIGTPHRGSNQADVASCLVKIVKLFHQTNDTMTKALKSQDVALQELDHDFNQLLTKRRGTKSTIEVRCFYETVPMKLQGLREIIVPSNSAAPPTFENSIGVDADHIGITKFTSRDDQTYKNVLAELRRMIKLAKERRRDAETDEAEHDSRATHIGNVDRGSIANYANQTISGSNGGRVQYGNTKTFNWGRVRGLVP